MTLLGKIDKTKKPHIQYEDGKWHAVFRYNVVSGSFEVVYQQAKVWDQLKQYDVINGIPVRYRQSSSPTPDNLFDSLVNFIDKEYK